MGAAAAPLGGWLLFTCCWVLAFMSMTGASRIPTAPWRSFREIQSNKPQVIRAKLMHRDHPESPLSVPGATVADRYNAAAARQDARTARRSLAAAGADFNTSITSALAEGVDEYIITLYFGTPVQKFFLIADTGSDLVWVQCLPCIQCFNETNPYFDPSASSSYSAVPCASSKCNQTLLGNPASCDSNNTCHISYAYAQPGSGYQGVLSTETITFDTTDEAVPNFLFGCMNNDTGSFGTVDGIAGFGRGPFSLPTQLSTSTSVTVFSYCLVPFIVSTTLTSSLVFGATETNELQLVYTPILSNEVSPYHYWVNMTGVSINGIPVSFPATSFQYNSTSVSGGTIFDSGTTYTELTNDVFVAVVLKLGELITYPTVQVPNSTLCYNISGVQELEYPSTTLHFAGVNGTTADFSLSGENLFIPSAYDDVACLGLAPSGALGFNIIGNIAQADHYVETDLENMRIGWASRNCSLPM